MVAIATMRDLCGHMSIVAMVTVRAGVDPKGWEQDRGGSFSSPQPTIKGREKEDGRRGPFYHGSPSFPSWEREIEHVISTNESSP